MPKLLCLRRSKVERRVGRVVDSPSRVRCGFFRGTVWIAALTGPIALGSAAAPRGAAAEDRPAQPAANSSATAPSATAPKAAPTATTPKPGQKPAVANPAAAPANAPGAQPAAPNGVQIQAQAIGGQIQIQANGAQIQIPANGQVQQIQLQGNGAKVQVQMQVQVGGAAPAGRPRAAAPPRVVAPRVAGPGGRMIVAQRGALGVDGAEAPEETVFRDPQREIVQRIKRSETMIAEGRFAEAVELLGSVLEEPDDYLFVNPDSESSTRVSLKNDAQRRIGELPPAGRAAYELQYGTKAAQLLDAALNEGDSAKLTEVARRYFHTRAGYQAAYLAALEHLDFGRPLAAALSLRRLRDTASIADQWEPELSLRLATAWARAGAYDAAQKVIDEAKAKYPAAEFVIAGEMKRWFAGDANAQAWLSQNTVGKVDGKAARPAEWAVFRGDSARNAVGEGGSPLLNRRWAVPFVNHPEIEKLVGRLKQSYDDREQILLPSAHPLAVDDVVLVRTFAGLTAVDFRTGKRIWRGAEDEAIRQVLDRDAPLGARRNDDSSQVANWINELSWHNATLGTFSSDGKRAYCVEQTPAATPDMMNRRNIILANGRQFVSGPPSLNRLAAYDLSTQGKLAWEISGGDANSADSYFLGPPLPMGDRLYVLGEAKGEIRLIALAADTGKVDWTQQLAIVDESTDMTLRRASGLSPSYADGVLVCPTSLGAVVGVDLNDRSLLWGFQFTRDNQMPNRHNVVMWQVNNRGEMNSESDHWQDSTVTLADGKVIIASPESQQLFCLNLLDGKLLWKQPRTRGLFVACVAAGNVVVAAADEMRAYSLADGKTTWTAPLPDGGKPSGRGFYNGKNYYLPLTTAEVAALDVASGRFTARSRSRAGNVPGNLVCYRGAVVSQGPSGVECFFQIDDLKREVAARLKDKPNDPDALASSGELLLDEGKVAEAIDVLRRSYAAAAESRTRNLLVDALLEGLGAGIAVNDNDLAELEQLVDGTERQETYLRLRGEALAKAGKRRAAFESFLRLADLAGTSDQPIRASADVSVRRERWVKARIDELLAGADADERRAMREEAERRRAATIASGDVEKMRRFLRYFDDGAEADSVRLQLAAKLIGSDELLEAENLLLAVASRGDSADSAEAVGRLTKLLVDAGRPAEAVSYYERLVGPLAGVKGLDGKTGRELAESIRAAADPVAAAQPQAWPLGGVDVEEVHTQQNLNFRTAPLEFRGERGPYFQGVNIEMDQPQQSIVCRDPVGNERWRVSLASTDRQNVNHFNQLVTHVRAAGHLLIVSLGSEVLAVDVLGAGGKNGARILWRHELTESVPGASPWQGVQQRVVQLPWGLPRFMAFDQFGRPIGVTGPTTARYVSYLKQRSLYVVEPLTGRTIWVRRGVDPASELFGDDEYIFVTTSGQGGETAKTIVLSAADGRELKKVDLPSSEERVQSYGRKLLTWKIVAGRARLALLDALEGKEVWRHEFSANARLWPIADDELSVTDRVGNFSVIAAADGTRRIEARVQPEPSLSEAYALRTDGGYLLITSSPFRQRDGVNVQPAPGHFGNPLVNGYLYGFDRTTKKQLFKTRINGHGLTLHQPAGLPMLVFASQIYEHQRNGQARSPQAVLLAIDKRNGRVLLDKRLTTPLNTVDISPAAEPNVIVVRTFREAFRFTFTDKPLAAESPEPRPTDMSDADDKPDVGRAITKSADELGKAVREVQKEIIKAEEERKKQAAAAKPAATATSTAKPANPAGGAAKPAAGGTQSPAGKPATTDPDSGTKK